MPELPRDARDLGSCVHARRDRIPHSMLASSCEPSDLLLLQGNKRQVYHWQEVCTSALAASGKLLLHCAVMQLMALLTLCPLLFSQYDSLPRPPRLLRPMGACQRQFS
jgi:hypothetical protein